MNWAYCRKVGSAAAKAVLVSLANQANDRAECWPSIETIATRVELSSRSVIANIQFLIDRGFLAREVRPGDGSGRKSNRYRLLMGQSESNSQRGKVKLLHLGQGEDGAGQSENDAGQSEGDSPKQSLTVKEQTLFDQAWNCRPRHPNDNRTAAIKAWNARVRAGISAEELLEGRKRYAKHCRAEGTNPKFVKHTSTFFGPNRYWEQDWSVQATLELPMDIGTLRNIRNAIGLAPFFDCDLKTCHREIIDYLDEHPESVDKISRILRQEGREVPDMKVRP